MSSICNNESFISQILKVVRPLGGKFNLFSPSGFEFQKLIMLYSVKALKRDLNEKNQIHGRETVSISIFGALIYETYFRSLHGSC